MRDLLSRWTCSGTPSGSVWNASISSRVSARPILTVLVRYHLEPFPYKRGFRKWRYIVSYAKNQDLEKVAYYVILRFVIRLFNPCNSVLYSVIITFLLDM